MGGDLAKASSEEEGKEEREDDVDMEREEEEEEEERSEQDADAAMDSGSSSGQRRIVPRPARVRWGWGTSKWGVSPACNRNCAYKGWVLMIWIVGGVDYPSGYYDGTGGWRFMCRGLLKAAGLRSGP
eukprot:751485-Hanusia_phi.AAC.2